MIKFLPRKRKKVVVEETDMVDVINVEKAKEVVKLTVKFDGKIWMELANFLKEKGFVRKGDGLSLLFAYGVSEREGIDIEKRRAEMIAIGSRHAVMKFKAFSLFDYNRALTIGLSVMLRENRRLREKAEEFGLISPIREAWDNWNQDVIDGFYKKYVFIR